MASFTLDDAADIVLGLVASESGGMACLSGDFVATTDDEQPVLSVIHLDTRQHWNIVVVTVESRDPDVTLESEHSLAVTLLGVKADTTLQLTTPKIPVGRVLRLSVEVLDPAKV